MIIILLSFLFIGSNIVAQDISKEINANWQFKQVGTKQWHTATVPGCVHTDLLDNKLIPDPFYRDNENKLQWISHVDWEYKTTFDVPTNIFSEGYIELRFEGLDTYAEVYLNGKHLLSANNMFRTWSINIKDVIHLKNNRLHIILKSADRIADSLARYSTIVHPCENNRNYVRKAQYQFGWDFAPKLTTSGIWRKIIITTNSLPSIYGRKEVSSNIINLIQQKDSIGTSFYFTKNNKPIFITGANWVPADVFPSRVTKTKYRELLIAAKEAGINMLRVWGGGIYEDDAFYDLCDSLQIMVWQDLMFAGAIYPGDKSFIENVKNEIEDNVRRICNHSCIVLWCGNNEIDEAWHNWGWQQQYHIATKDSIQLWKEYNQLFNVLIPEWIKRFDHYHRPYISSSPKNGWGRKESMSSGDAHYWGVWWGLEPIEAYTKKIPRFMSEYGMQSLPNVETIHQFALPQDLDTASIVMRLHQKHPTGFKNLATYLQQNNFHPTTFVSYIDATQTLQALALRTAITAHIHARPYCMGTMFWQFNDCYPGISWSVIDYYGRKKKAYFVVKELYNSIK